MKDFGGKALFLDRADINTDEIIPAKYLTETSKEALAPHLLEDLNLEGFDPRGESLKEARVIVARENFGCGSSREHAPWALEVNGISAVIAPSFARIFRQNMFNCGMLALEIAAVDEERLFRYRDTACSVEFDLAASKFRVRSERGEETFSFALAEFDRALVEAGGWVEYADRHY